MPRPELDLDSHKDYIIHLFLDCKQNTDAIAATLAQKQLILSVNQRTIQRRLKQWGVGKRVKTEHKPDLRSRIEFFWNQNYSDEQILEFLTRDGYVLGPWALKRIRKQEGLYRKSSPYERQGETVPVGPGRDKDHTSGVEGSTTPVS